MALINTSENKVITIPGKESSQAVVGAVWLIPTQHKKLTTQLQGEFYRALEVGEQAGPYSKIEGYTQIEDCGPHNLGEAPTHMGLATFEQDLHDFAISILGVNFEKQ